MAIYQNKLLKIPLHPLLISTVTLMVGIWLQSSAYTPIPWTLIGILMAICCMIMKIASLSPTLVYSLIACASGAFFYQRQIDYYTTFYEQISFKSSYDLVGTITDIQPLDHQRYTHCITLNKNQLSSNTSPPLRTDMLITLYSNNFANFQIGDTIAVSNMVFKQQKNQSFKHYLIKQNTIATVFSPKECMVKLISRPTYSIDRWIFNKKIELYKSLKSKMSLKTFSFFSSLFLGIKHHNYYQEKLREHFKWWGLSHYLARSGLHLIIFIVLWKIFFCLVPLPYKLKQGALMVIALVYFLLSWSSIPFARAFFSFIAYCLFLLFDQQINGLHILTIVTLTILILNPMQLFFLDFQLSFGLTFALLWFNFLQSNASKENSLK